MPAAQTQVLIALFSVAYLVHLTRRLTQGRVDLYDFAVLSAVALLPAAFILVPPFAEMVARVTGAAFPFTVLFGALLFVLFVVAHRLTSRLHRLEEQNRSLVQKIAMVELALRVEGTARGGERVT